jgi:hypothetical protein
MQRNPFYRQAAGIRQQIAVATQDASSQGAPVAAANGAQQAGANDATTGVWQSFGRLDITTFGEGFRLA